MKHIKLFEQFLNERVSINESVSFNNKSTGRDDWDKILKKSGDDFIQFEVQMTPDEFLKKVQADRFTQDIKKIEQYAQQFKKGAKSVPTPTMWFQDEFQWKRGLSPTWHDGSHRVLALKQIGVKKIPVKIIY